MKSSRHSLIELTAVRLQEIFEASTDVRIVQYFTDETSDVPNPYLIYCEGMIDSKLLNDFRYEQLDKLLTEAGQGKPFELRRMNKIQEPNALETLINAALSGNLVLFFEADRTAYSFEMANPPQRTTDESSTEISIKGPRDGFTESLETNVALVRKRLKTPKLGIRKYVVGSKSATNVSVLYLTDVANPETIEEVGRRIEKIETDSLISSQHLEEGLSDASYSLFPLLDYVGRPDYITEALLRGRFAVMIDGSPMVLIGPTNLTSLIKSPEDMHLPFYYVSLERLLRLIGLVVAIFFPGFWVAISAFNLEQIPFPLLATITVSRLGLPLSGPIDLFLMIGLFELFREAGMRLPKAVGQTVAVVGGLIVGDAAISAGLTGPTTLVVSAVTAVSTFTLVNQSLSGAVTVVRFFTLTMSSLFGMLGFFLSMFLIIVYLSSLTSFGVPFLAPISPVKPRQALFAIISFPWKLIKKRPMIYSPQDPTRKKENT